MKGIEQIKQKVKNHEPPALIALGGSERALIEDALNYIRKHLTQGDDSQLNYHRFLVGESSTDNLVATLKTAPFLSPKRIVEVHNAEKISAKTIQDLIEYIDDPSPFSVLILLFTKVDKRSKFISVLNKKGYLVVCDEVKGSDVLRIISNDAREKGLHLNSEVAQFLALVMDNDLIAIRSALEKLSLGFEGGEVNVDDIVNHVVGSGAQDVFHLAKFISEGNISQSLFMLGLIRQAKENALKFFGVLAWQFRTLLNIRHGLDRGMSEWEIRKSVFVYGDRFTWMVKVAKMRNISFHIGRLCRLLDCDLALKTQKISDPFSLIEKIIYQSAGGLYPNKTKG